MNKVLAGFVLLALAGCASTPSGPNVMVLPGSGKSFDQFRADDFECRQYAFVQSGAQAPDQAGVDSGVKSAAVGAAVGAVAGAALGRSGHAAVAGAGIGTAGGALAGTGAAAQTGGTVQHRYDMAFQQCMYAKGHQIPMAGARYSAPSSYRQAAPPPPPPPPGTPPPPPPRPG
jgi:outer membrane lipoprotein SlyB